MKKIIATVLQFALFLLVFGAFSLFPPFRMQHVLYSTPTGTRMFIADGLVLTLALFLVSPRWHPRPPSRLFSQSSSASS
jgi:hypothetical protein